MSSQRMNVASDRCKPPDELSLPAALGIQPGFAADELGPPVDEERVRRFCRQQLSPDEATEVSQLIAGFGGWHECWRGMVRTERLPISAF